MASNMDFLFGLLPDFYKDFFEDKEMLLEVWDGYKGKFSDEYNRLYELAQSISLPRAPFVHREYFASFTFDTTTAENETTFIINNNVVKVEKLSESPDPDRSNFFIEEGKDYRIKVLESGSKVLEFIRTVRVVLDLTFITEDHPTVPAGSKFFVTGESRYIQLASDSSGDQAIGYYIREIDNNGDEVSPLTTSTSLDIPADLSYVTQASIGTLQDPADFDSYLDRLGPKPIPKHLYAYRVSRNTQIIEKNFGAFIDYPNQRDTNDLQSLRSVIYDSADPLSEDFLAATNNLSIEGSEIIHDATRSLRELELYKLRVNALWFALWNGPSERNLNIAASIFVGLPIAEFEGEVKTKEKDYNGRWVISITNGTRLQAYTLPRGVQPDSNIEVGAPISMFQPIARNAAVVYDRFIDEERFKATMVDMYDKFTSNIEEECGVIFDDQLSFDLIDPCERIYFDMCTPDDSEDTTLCYRDGDRAHSEYSIIIYEQVDSTHLRVPYRPPIYGGYYQLQDLNSGDIELVQFTHFNFDPSADGGGVMTIADPTSRTYSGGSLLSSIKEDLFMVEDNSDCSSSRLTRSCSTEYPDPNNPGETVTVGNYPDDFYDNFRYVFMLDVLGATSILGSDFEGMYNFLYRIKPSYAHFIINMTIEVDENLYLGTETTLSTDICELYDEKQLFFDNYLDDAPNIGADTYDYAQERIGTFFDDPRYCIVSLFDSGETEVALTDIVSVSATESTASQIDLGSDVPSP